MKECKILSLDPGSCTEAVYLKKGNTEWFEFPPLESIINEYINQGFTVKSISSQNNFKLYVYLERDTSAHTDCLRNTLVDSPL